MWAVNGLAVVRPARAPGPVDLPAWSVAGPDAARTSLVAVLRDHGLDARPSDANWVLVEAPGLRARLAPHGIVVRDCTSFGMPEHGAHRRARAARARALDEALSVDRSAPVRTVLVPGDSSPLDRKGTS